MKHNKHGSLRYLPMQKRKISLRMLSLWVPSLGKETTGWASSSESLLARKFKDYLKSNKMCCLSVVILTWLLLTTDTTTTQEDSQTPSRVLWTRRQVAKEGNIPSGHSKETANTKRWKSFTFLIISRIAFSLRGTQIRSNVLVLFLSFFVENTHSILAIIAGGRRKCCLATILAMRTIEN